jgi:transposase InsO family protein
MSFIDDYTRFAWIYFLKHKDDAKKAIKDYVTRIEKQFDTTILRFRTDGGGEYIINKDITNYFDSQGIAHEPTPPYTPESNGVAERFNGRLPISNRARSIAQ